MSDAAPGARTPIDHGEGWRAALRHTVATIAYRAGKVLRDAPPGFASHAVGPNRRTPVAILAHMSDVLTWGMRRVRGEPAWEPVSPGTWEEELVRFYAALHDLDAALAECDVAGYTPPRVLQGPLADVLTHVGQLAFIRGLVDAPVRGENYAVADVETGRVGPDQPPPKREH